MNDKQRMLQGDLYLASDPELQRMSTKCKKLLDAFNQTSFADAEQRVAIGKKLFGQIGEESYVNKPFYCDYGKHISIGDWFYANVDCVMLDVCPITIGNHVMFGPSVHVYTATHPIDAGVRDRLLEYGKPVVIGSSVWVGGMTVINPGVTIGDNVVIGSGSVVTKDIPSNVIAAGNPCTVIRPITNEDKAYWEQQETLYHQEK